MFTRKICDRVQDGVIANRDLLERYDGIGLRGRTRRFWWRGRNSRMRLMFNIVVMMRCTLVTTWWRRNVRSFETLKWREIGL